LYCDWIYIYLQLCSVGYYLLCDCDCMIVGPDGPVIVTMQPYLDSVGLWITVYLDCLYASGLCPAVTVGLPYSGLPFWHCDWLSLALSTFGLDCLPSYTHYQLDCVGLYCDCVLCNTVVDCTLWLWLLLWFVVWLCTVVVRYCGYCDCIYCLVLCIYGHLWITLWIIRYCCAHTPPWLCWIIVLTFIVYSGLPLDSWPSALDCDCIIIGVQLFGYSYCIASCIITLCAVVLVGLCIVIGCGLTTLLPYLVIIGVLCIIVFIIIHTFPSPCPCVTFPYSLSLPPSRCTLLWFGVASVGYVQQCQPFLVPSRCVVTSLQPPFPRSLFHPPLPICRYPVELLVVVVIRCCWLPLPCSLVPSVVVC